MNIDPKWRFIIGLCVTFAIGVSQGTVSLTNAIPDFAIKPVVAWCGLIAFIGSAATTAISGLGMTSSSRIASAAAVPEVQTIITTSKSLADSGGDKVVKS